MTNNELFEYTEGGTANSSAVAAVYYDDKTKRVLVVKGNWDYIYQVDNRKDYTDFVDAPSVGRAWKGFKKAFGPANKVTPRSLVERTDITGQTESAVGTPKALVETPETVDSSPEKKVITWVDGASISGDGAVHIPNVLVPETYPLKAPAVESGSINASNPLTGTISSGTKRKHTVIFTIPGLEGERKHNVNDVTSPDAAVSALSESLAALDLDFKVKGVYVSFE